MKYSLPAVLLILPAIIALPLLSAQAAGTLEYYGVESTINDDMTVKTALTIRFAEPVNSSEFRFSHKAYNISWASTFDSADCRLSGTGRTITCNFTGMTRSKNLLAIAFYSDEGIAKSQNRFNFSSSYEIPEPAKEAFILVKIPQSSVLSEPANESYSPPDGKILSDRMVYWQRENVTDALDISVSYSIPSVGPAFDSTLIVAVAGVLIISMIAVAVYVRRGPIPGKTTAEVVASVLNTDEKKVVDILARHGGKSGQKIIVRESDFSKAKVSRLVKNLKARGVVDIEPISGRENRIILRFEKKPETSAEATEKPESPETKILE